MDRKEKDALILALAEKGKTYREITKEAGVSPNRIKAVLNKAGLDENTSISSRAFELYSQQRTPSPLEVAIKLDLKSEDAIRFHQEYFMLLGCTEFTKAYLQVKENPWPFVDLVKLAQNSRMKDGELVELLKIANGYLPRVRLEYNRVKEEKSSLEAELNSWKVAIRNEVRVYQDFCDRNLKLKKREDELQLNINELEAKKAELQKTTTQLQQHLVELRESYTCRNNLNTEAKQETIIPTNDVFIPSPNMVIDYHQNEIEINAQVEPSSRTLIFDTKSDPK